MILFRDCAFCNYSLWGDFLQQVRIHDVLDITGTVNAEAWLWTVGSRPWCICLIVFGAEADGLSSQHRQCFLWLNLIWMVRGRSRLSRIMHILVYVEAMWLLVEGLDSSKCMFRVVWCVEGGALHNTSDAKLGPHRHFTRVNACELTLRLRVRLDHWRWLIILLNEVGIWTWD